ncbi:thymidylate synthase [Roseobacter phage CRP-804]|uniref:Thymidylate synthase n=1 Tax=Roseobacter phage CRP-804 TaxID=3072850 RepID=A0AAX3ZVZ4_9CAUD|nr:thymidylate synthase [Roseobacter phage CRP-804]
MSKIKVTYIDHMGDDLSVVNAARVSFGKKSEFVDGEIKEDEVGPYMEMVLSNKDKKLIRYLAKHKHLSPFGHAFASFHVKAPIFVARQLVKHKFLRWNEISRRYVDDEPEFYMPDVWRGRSADKKQGSDGVVDLEAINSWGDPYEGRFCEATLGEIVYEEAQEISYSYDLLIKAGVAPEQARMVLPQSTMTEWYWSGSLDAFAAMCQLRCASDTQYESQIVANQISEYMAVFFPVSWEALLTTSQ